MWVGFTVLMILNCISVLIFGYGIFNASSMDTSMIALMCIFPIVALWDFYLDGSLKVAGIPLVLIIVILPVVTILLTQGSTAYFVLAAGALGVFWVQRAWMHLIAMFIIIVSSGAITQGEKFLSSSGRFWHWKMFMQWWWDNANIWIGAGSGSFNWLGPAIQGPSKEAFLYMHNEYLQVLFEQGIIGFILLMALWLTSMWKVRKSAWLFGTFCAASVSMLTQFPLRYFASQVFIALLIHEAHTLKHRV